jgi:hypothetical protein
MLQISRIKCECLSTAPNLAHPETAPLDAPKTLVFGTGVGVHKRSFLNPYAGAAFKRNGGKPTFAATCVSYD